MSELEQERRPIAGPFATLEAPRLRILLWASGLLAGLLFVALAVIDGRISAEGGPGIVGLEVAGTAERSAEILADWGESGRSAARVSLWLDFPFMLAYAVFLGAACTTMGRRLRRRSAAGGSIGRLAGHLAGPGAWLGWAFILAALLDLIENIALLRVIDFALVPWSRVAQLMASPKLAIFGAGLFYLLVGLLLTARWTRARDQSEIAKDQFD